MDYLFWNNAIASHFFNKERDQQGVYLCVTRELISKIAERNRASFDSFIEAIKTGPSWITDQRLSICGSAHRCYQEWRSREPDAEYPPYLAYLAFFVLPAAEDHEFSPLAYYKPYHRLLGESEVGGRPAKFDLMWELWQDLEDWSCSDRNGELGLFEFRMDGNHDHTVGIPFGQTLLADDDRKSLLSAFMELGLDSEYPPVERELIQMLRDHSKMFSRRLQRLLECDLGSSSLRALLGLVRSELENWDGSVVDVGDSTTTAAASLRLCCEWKKLEKQCCFYYRIKTAAAFPDHQLQMSVADHDVMLSCKERQFGFSERLKHLETNVSFDATEFNWQKTICLTDVSWKVVGPGSKVRVFERGTSHGLPDWVEALQMKRNQNYLIASTLPPEDMVDWGSKACGSLLPITEITGLPRGWNLYAARDLRASSNRAPDARLEIPSTISVKFKHGVKARKGRGTRYFSFAPPTAVIENSERRQIVTVGGSHVCSTGIGEIELPVATDATSAQKEARIEIKVFNNECDESKNEKEIKKKSCILVSEMYRAWNEHPCSIDVLGRFRSDQAVRGALVMSDNIKSFDFSLAIPPLPDEKIWLLGRKAGQITEWPAASYPEWSPIWAIVKQGKKKYLVIPCSADLNASAPDRSQKSLKPRKLVKRWKKFVWDWRKRIAPPQNKDFEKLWAEYREVGKNV